MSASRIAERSAAYALQAAVQPAFGASFDLLATAPKGVAKLRELILLLAFRGRLLPQGPNDETATNLLSRVRAEKRRLISTGILSKEKPVEPISDGEVDYQLPIGWVWARLPELYSSISPGSKKLPTSAIKDRGPIPVVDQGQRYIAGYTDDASLSLELPGPVIIFGDHTTEVKYVDFNFVAGADGVKILRPILQNEKFFFLQLRAYELESRGYARHFKVLNTKLFAVAPLAEQARIVARVEELMQLCDALEAHDRLQDEQHARLVATLFNALAASESAEALAENWQRIATHFDLLLDRPEAVDTLEQTLLQLAVRGLLVPQDPTDEPASNLLDRIRAENARLIEAGLSKRSKALLDVSADEQAFESPNGWQWARMDDYCEVQGGIQKTPLRRPVKNHFPYLRVANVQRNALDLGTLERYELNDEEVERWRLRSGDLLVVEGNGSEKEIGRCAIWRGAVDPCVFQNHLIRVRPLLVAEAVEFLQLFLNSPDGATEMMRLAITTSGLYNLSVGKIRNLAVPVPPLAEQHRILARVEQLRSLCANLRERLQQSCATQSQLADALVNQAGH